MDEDGYVPQISQIDYNLMDNGGTNGSSSASTYYNPINNHMPGVYSGDVSQQHQYQHPQMMQGQAMPHAYHPGMSAQMGPPHGMMGAGQMGQMQSAQQVPAKPKRGGRKKNTTNQQAETVSNTPTQQPLPASYPSHQMNPQMMQQMRQSNNPYGYQMQSQQKWSGTDYNGMQQQYRPMGQQPYGYPPMHPSAQNYYGANQQRPPPQYYQQYPAGFSGQTPRYPTPQTNQQQYYMDPNMYNYPAHASGVAYPPQAAQTSQKPEMMGQQTFQQTPNPYQQQGKAPQSTNSGTSSAYPAQSTSSQPNSQWPSSYNGSGTQPNYYGQQTMNPIQNIQRELIELERQYQQYNYQPKTPEMTMRLDHLYKRIAYLKQQIMSMQQPSSQQSPQATPQSTYPNYPSNGQVMDSATNSTVPTISSASTVPSVEKVPSRSSISSQDQNSSVSVMQTAGSQVQVNITPEVTGGHTLISVYHQYPSTGVLNNSTNPSTYKDAIPPEPVPSSVSNEIYTRQQSANQIISTSTSSVNNAVTVESKPKTLTSTSSSYSTYSTQQNTSPIPPQPIPTNSNFSSFELNEKVKQSSETSQSFDGEHLVQRVENVRSNESSKAVTLQSSTEKHVETVSSEKSEDQKEDQNDSEPFEAELDDLQPPAAPRMISNYEEEDDELDKHNTEDTSNEVEREEKDEDTSNQQTLISEEIITNPSTVPVVVEPSTSYIEAPVNQFLVQTPIQPIEVVQETKKKKTPRGKTSNRGRKSGTLSRKRKKSDSEEEEYLDNDNDFVPEPSKKRSKGKSNAAAKSAPVEEPKLDEFVEKRRSERNNKTERKTYSEKMDIDEDLLEEFRASTSEIPSVEDSPAQLISPEWVVEKILGVRLVTKMLPKESIEEEEQAEDSEVTNPDKKSEKISKEELKNKTADKTDKEVELVETQVEEIYVKFKGKSYLHCEWKTVDELEEIDRRIVGKINRYKAKYGEAYLDDSEYFNEDYTVVDRVLDEHIDEESGEHSAFIKWRSLPYEDCTWEDIEIVPKSKLKEFHARNDVVDPCKLKERSRPDPAEWVKLPEGKEYKYENTLRDYQYEGVNWLLFCYYNRQNCILADEMGLGKTIQSITFLQGVYDKGIHGPYLIVVPLSTLHNWEREFENWTDMNAIVYHGSAASREIIQNYEMWYDRGDTKKKQIVKFDALLTTYEMVVSDCEVLRKFNYRVCVIDEAHRLKNRNSKLLTGGLLSFKMEHRVLLTGTPLQNNVQELYSLLNFLEPEQFSNSDSFLEQFGQCQTEEQVQKLQEILKPMMLRRLKEDVEKTLQPKEETIIEVQLTNIQKKYYRAIHERNFTHLLKGSSAPSLMNVMMELRKVCNHPFLIKSAEEQIISEFKTTHPDKSEEELQCLSLIQSSGKMVLIDKLLPKLQQDGHKVLIFSQMVRVLDLLEEYLVHMNYLFERIDGNIRGDQRQAAIDRFSKPDSDRFIFLLCTRAGGLGINLTAADTVIIFDSDWNPQNDLQAQARCHRIGQTKMVKVYRLITANTYERDMFDKASLKLGLDKAVLQSMTPKDNQQPLSRKEVEDLLRKGAYGAVMDENDEGNKFNEEDIETILQRRTQTVRLEPGIKGSTFAKASFSSSNNRDDIDWEDPNFWAKWAQKANVDINAAENHLIMSEPRARRKRFEDNYKGLHEGENGSDEGSDDDGETSRGRGNRGSDFSKSRSGKKRRKDDDDDYVNYNAPDELTFNKSEFFKVEKLLSAWGWGRWKAIKANSDVMLSEKDIEHIGRTLLLHCIREYRGDEKSREFVWQLILPKGAVLGKGGKKGIIGGGLYHEGWATLPEYNPPAFAVDSSFQRHVHRHASKLMQRIFHLFVLQAQILGSVDENTVQNKSHKDIPLDVPVIGDPPLPNWDTDCDKSFLIGIYKHGMENYETIRADPKLCFIEKEIEEMPTTIELNTRFKRIILMLSRKLEMALAAATNAQNSTRLKRWPRAEEAEFMRLLKIYGVKDDHEGLNVINWNRFRELSTNLQQKTDAELLEELYCVLAMCTKQQGGDLSDIDRRRASLVESIPSKQAERLMFRLHLMRKIHAIITTGISNVRTSLKLCSNKTMPAGWGELQDEQLMIVVDMHGLDNIVAKISKSSAFEKLKDSLDELSLLRRVIEITTTLETGRWNGKGSIDMLDDDGGMDSGSQTPVRSGMQQQVKRGRKKNSTSTNPLVSSTSPTSLSQANAVAQSLMEAAMTNPSYLLPLLSSASGTGASSSNLQQQQLQQFQALMTMYALSSMLPSMSSDNSAATKQAMAALAMMGEDALNLTVNPKKNASSSSTSKPITSSAKATTSTNDLMGQFNVSELLALFNIPEETNIPVVNIETSAKLTGDKAPKLKNLDQWLAAHPKYRVDTSVVGGNTSSSTKEAATSKTEKTESNGVFKQSTLEPGEIPKAQTSATSSSNTETNKSGSDVKIGVFYKSTGAALPQEKWPLIENLESWLIKNPNAQVQSAFAPFAKELLPKSMHDRIGGETASTSSSSASNSLQQAASSAAAANLTNAMNLESLQVQMYLQQKLMESLNPTSYQNPYSSLLGGSSSNSSSAANNLASSLSASGLDANSAALLALFGAQLPASTVASQSSSSQATKSSTSSSLMNEAALTAELLANPSLAMLLNNSALTNNNASSLASSMSSFPFNMDFNTALQLNALTNAANMGSLTQSSISPSLNANSIATLLGATQTASSTASTPTTSKKTTQSSSNSRASKLDTVIGKLAASSNLNNSS